MLTDSGGFQVFSLTKLRKITERRRRVPLPPRRLQTLLLPGALHGRADRPRRRHHHGLRRVRRIPRPTGTRARALHGASPMPGPPAAARQHFSTKCRGARPTGSAQSLFGIVQGGMYPGPPPRIRRAPGRHGLPRLRHRRPRRRRTPRRHPRDDRPHPRPSAQGQAALRHGRRLPRRDRGVRRAWAST